MLNAIIIGASSGIGEALAKLLVQNQYTVGITGRRFEKLQNLKNSAPEHFFVRSFDCTTADNTTELNALVNDMGGLDLLILCSGTGAINHTLDLEKEASTNALNVTAFTEITNWAWHYFKTKGTGQYVVISSIAGLRGSRYAPAYNASKAYQINYLEGLRQKVQKEKLKLKITDIRPGFVDTAMAQGEGLFWVASREKAATQILKHIRQDRAVAYVTNRWRFIALLMKTLPRFLYRRL